MFGRFQGDSKGKPKPFGSQPGFTSNLDGLPFNNQVSYLQIVRKHWQLAMPRCPQHSGRCEPSICEYVPWRKKTSRRDTFPCKTKQGKVTHIQFSKWKEVINEYSARKKNDKAHILTCETCYTFTREALSDQSTQLQMSFCWTLRRHGSPYVHQALTSSQPFKATARRITGAFSLRERACANPKCARAKVTSSKNRILP